MNDKEILDAKKDQQLLLKLVEKGFTREDAYAIVQKHALSALQGGNFKQALIEESVLSSEEIEECFNTESYLKNIDKIFDRF